MNATDALEFLIVGATAVQVGTALFIDPRAANTIADGIVSAVKEVGLKVPLVVRLEGTNVELGKKILQDSKLNVVAAADMADGAKKIVGLAR